VRRFADRRAAGRALAGTLLERGRPLHRPIVLALPRGGVPVAFEVAQALHAPLDVLVARKIGAPGHPEFGIGAIAEGGVVVIDQRSVDALGITPDRLAGLVSGERRELDRRVERYREGRSLPEARDRDIVLVDDGWATGVTAEAAVGATRRLGPRRVVLAAPVSAEDTAERLAGVADEVVTVRRRSDLGSVGRWYDDFTQTLDAEVVGLLDRARRTHELRSHPEADE